MALQSSVQPLHQPICLRTGAFPMCFGVAIASVLLMLPNASAQAQGSNTFSLVLEHTQQLADSLIDFGDFGFTRYERLPSGEVLVGSVRRRGTHVAYKLSPDFREARPVMRRGFGPGEASGVFASAATPEGGWVVAAPDLGRSDLFSANGEYVGSAGITSVADGVGICDGEVIMTGVGDTDRGGLPAIYASVIGTKSVRLLHSLHVRSPRRHSPGLTDLLAIRKDRLVAVIPNRAEIAISDVGCDRIRRVSLDLPWFEAWDNSPSDKAWMSGLNPKIHAVRWYSDEIVLLLAYRIVGAKPIVASKKGEMRLDPGSPFPATRATWESVLIAVRASDGAVLAELAVPRVNHRFLSGDELLLSTADVEKEWLDVYRVRLMQQ